MRQRNMRFIVTGIALALLAAVFFVFMMGMAPKSNDPAALMQTVGEVSGAAGAIGIFLAILGVIGKKT